MAYYLDLAGLERYDTKIKQFIHDNIPDAASALVNALDNTDIFKIGICTQAEYDALGDNWEEGVLYIISDDNTLQELTSLITTEIQNRSKLIKEENEENILVSNFDSKYVLAQNYVPDKKYYSYVSNIDINFLTGTWYYKSDTVPTSLGLKSYANPIIMESESESGSYDGLCYITSITNNDPENINFCSYYYNKEDGTRGTNNSPMYWNGWNNCEILSFDFEDSDMLEFMNSFYTKRTNRVLTSEYNTLEELERQDRHSPSAQYVEVAVTEQTFVPNTYYVKTEISVSEIIHNFDINGLHRIDRTNPHNVTKTQVGLSDVANKPLMTSIDKDSTTNDGNYATIGAIKDFVNLYGGKIDSLSINGITLTIDSNKNVEIPTVRTDINNQSLSSAQKTNAKTNLDLNNVDNTADLDKPVSTATQTALDTIEIKVVELSASSGTLSAEAYSILNSNRGIIKYLTNNKYYVRVEKTNSNIIYSHIDFELSTDKYLMTENKFTIDTSTLGFTHSSTSTYLYNTTSIDGFLSNKQDKSNLVTSWQSTPDDTHYPSEKLVKDSLDLKSDTSSTVLDVQYDTTNKKITKTIGTSTTDVVTASKLKEDMSLNNVDNTSDADKPISTSTQNALDLKVDKTSVGYIEISGNSGTLTNDQYNEALKPYCIIKRGYEFWYKDLEDSGSISFKLTVLGLNNVTAVKQLLKDESLWITKSTKGWTYGYFTKTFYTDEGTDALLATKLALAKVATIETSTTASKAYAVGDLLIYNEVIYRVINAIASGGTITVGTNVVAKTIEELLALKVNYTDLEEITTTEINALFS